jgi:hypothetical protein
VLQSYTVAGMVKAHSENLCPWTVRYDDDDMMMMSAYQLLYANNLAYSGAVLHLFETNMARWLYGFTGMNWMLYKVQN